MVTGITQVGRSPAATATDGPPLRRRSLRLVASGWAVLRGGLAAAGLTTLILAGLIAVPLKQPAELMSISTTAKAVDRSDMPATERLLARDGTSLAYRHCPATAPSAGKIAMVIHGSSAASFAVHGLAKGLAGSGIETYAPDIRGHGGSGSRGDIGYIGQLEDDLADFVGEIRKTHPDAPLTLLGHSSGGGFALRVAASPIQDLFARTVLLAPYLGWKAPSSRPDAGGWASPDIPRIMALQMLQRLGLTCCEHLPVLALAVAPASTKLLTARYSFALMRNFSTEHVADDVAAARGRLSLIAGADDELMDVANYQQTVGPRVPVQLIPSVNHMAVVSDPAAVSAIADELLKDGP